MTDTERDAWEYWPGIDTTDSWAGFVCYRSLPPPRKLTYVAQTVGVDYQTVRKWAKEGYWDQRARAWDLHLDEIRREEFEALVREDQRVVAGRHLESVRKALAIADQELAKLVRDCSKTPLNVVAPKDLIRLLDMAIKTERLVRGQATEVVASAVDLSKLTDEQLQQYETLVALAAAK